MSAPVRVLRPDLVWRDGGFVAGEEVVFDGAGRIDAVRPVGSGPLPPEAEVILLPDRALLPGFVNAHSHAFQRGLRGRGERFEAGAGSFWSWREAMYGLVETLTPEGMHALARQAFTEMLAAGMTTVGEFHYAHHGPDARRFELDDAVVAAAREVGIRLVLLQVHYRTGDLGTPLGAAQARFDTQSLDAYWTQFDRLAGRLDPAIQTLGVVAHSIRAVPIDEIVALAQEAARRDAVLHMHVEEQPREIASCEAHHGCTPMRLLLDHNVVSPRFTAVHCTHTDAEDLDAMLGRGGRVCLCPLTEANLGDGLADGPRLHGARAQVCLGSDSNARISMLEEMRWLEYGQRLQLERRGVWTDERGDVGGALIDVATAGGAGALGVAAGRIATGCHADLITIALDDPRLAGVDAEHLAAALVLGAGDGIVRDVWVGGRAVVGGG